MSGTFQVICTEFPDRWAADHEVVVLVATGLAEQLALAWMPWLLRSLGGRPDVLHVVQFEHESKGNRIVSRNRSFASRHCGDDSEGPRSLGSQSDPNVGCLLWVGTLA
jgi:hypothetical protein